MTDFPFTRPTRVRWLIFALACAVSWLLYLHRYAWGVVRPAVKSEYGLSDVELGWLDSLFNATYALGQVPGGLAGDLLGPRAVLSLLIAAWSGTVAWLGWGHGFAQFAGIRAAFGLAQAGAYPNLSKVTRSWFPPSVRTTVQGVVGVLSGRAGGACASLLVAAVLMGLLGLSWRQALVALGAGGLTFALVFWVLFRDSPREHPQVNPAERALIESGDAPAPPGVGARLRLSGDNAWTLGALLLFSFASTFADQLYVFWLPQFLVEGKGLSASAMGLFAGLPLWGGALGGVAGGALNDVLIRATGSRRVGRSAVAFTGKLLAAGLIVVSVGVADGRLVMVVLFACKFFGDWSLPTQWGAVTDISGPAAGTVFGVVNTAGSVAGFAAGPVLGWLKGRHGWEGLFLAVAGAYLVAALCWLVIDSTRPLVGERFRR
jgi:MFS transporter, ACS family, glucarate transporter